MYCPQCGASNVDGAAFCSSCGTSFAQRAAQQAAASHMANTPNQAAPLSPVYPVKQGFSLANLLAHPKMLALGALIVLILLVLLVRAVACSGPAKPNLVDLATKDTAAVANILKGYKSVQVSGDSVFASDENAPNDMYVAQLNAASGNTSQDEALKTLQKYDGHWVVHVMKNATVLSLNDITNGANPTRIGYTAYVAGDKMTARQLADYVAQIAPYDNCVFTSGPDGSTLEGMAKGNGCVTRAYAIALRGTDGKIKEWSVAVTSHSISEDSNGSKYSASFDTEYASFNASNYTDSYKK